MFGLREKCKERENKKKGGNRKRIICLVGKKWREGGREGKKDGGNEF